MILAYIPADRRVVFITLYKEVIKEVTCQVILTCPMHRPWNTTTNKWGPRYSTYPLYPISRTRFNWIPFRSVYQPFTRRNLTSVVGGDACFRGFTDRKWTSMAT